MGMVSLKCVRRCPVGVAIDKRDTLLVADDVGNEIWRVAAAAQRP